jgi:hypothetical protein
MFHDVAQTGSYLQLPDTEITGVLESHTQKNMGLSSLGFLLYFLVVLVVLNSGNQISSQ